MSDTRVFSRPVLVSAVLCILGMTSGVSFAADEAEIQVLAIRATNSNTEVSPELRAIAPALLKNLKVSGLRLEKSERGKATADKPHNADFVGGYKTRVTLVERKDKRITLQILITRSVAGKPDAKIFETKVTIDAGTSQNFDFPWPGGGDDKLVLSISAK